MAVKKEAGALPFNAEEEQAVLGMMMYDGILMTTGLGALIEEDFYVSKNRQIFAAMKRLYEKDISITDDIGFLVEELMQSNVMDEIGETYITDLVGMFTTTVNFDDHVIVLKNNATLRKLLIEARRFDNKFLTEGAKDISSFVDSFTTRVTDINDHRRIEKFQNVGDLIDKFRTDLQERAGKGGTLAYDAVTTGYDNLDDITNGFKKGEYIVIGARPSMGKTALAINVALNCAYRTKRPIGFFSLEMPNQQILQRMLSITSKVESRKLTTGTLDQIDYLKLDEAYKEVSGAKIYIDDSTNNSVMAIEAKALKLKNAQPKLAMIVIDYLGLIKGDMSLESEQVRVTHISSALKGMAKRLELPVVVLSQLSRGTEGRNNKKPQMSDIRSSGSIEQDADIIMFIYREDYYLLTQGSEDESRSRFSKDGIQDERKEAKQYLAQKMDANGYSFAEIIVAKNRNGHVGTARLAFNKACGVFEQLTPEDEALAEKAYGKE